MATQRPGGTRPTTSRTTKPQTASKQGAKQKIDRWGELGADTAVWHTRGLQTNTRMRAPVAQRTPPRQLPPSPVPKLILWAVLIGIALVCFQTVKHLL
ncbi:hypothetical protein [Cupriavidus pauculus]|uniref:hypothetical protein n=1 Tax=Cupriavidus pauculus TaxID=82633 RepID=UPI001EE193DC|nr:hypothetical protein [Cupriavidus pauculus]GJG97169.1 hypothetical protein CBA19C6_21790 [Cupriavidus pauculus]